LPARLQKIDEHTRPDHYYLDENDECYYLLEYAARKRSQFGPTNDLILNLKKPVDRRTKPEYRYKIQAIAQAAQLLRSALNDEWLPTAVLIPIPCSKAKDHPLYDDRILRVLRQMGHGLPCDIRELIIQTETIDSFHDGCRMTPDELRCFYQLDEQLCLPDEPSQIAVFDDILTTGCHFKAIQAMLLERWPDVSVSGIFIARRYFPAEMDPV
jgi:hypothetical protein